MTQDSTKHIDDTPEKGPPSDGRQDHLAMRAAAMIPVTGAEGVDALATGGGLDVPGHEPEETARRAAELPKTASIPEPIPGAYEKDTAMHREPGTIGGRFNGADASSAESNQLMDDRTIREHRREGGGGSG